MMLRQFGHAVGTNPNGFFVAQRSAGANMSVDVNVGTANIEITTGTNNGIGQAISDSIANLVIGANASGLPRIDQVFLQYNDAGIPAGVGGNVPTLRVVAGTPTSGATLANRLGAATQPADTLRLADVLVANGAATILQAAIQDRRTMMYGQRIFVPSSGARSDFTRSTTSTLLPEMTATADFASGRPVDIHLEGCFNQQPVSGGEITFELRRNGSIIYTRTMAYAGGTSLTATNFEPWSFKFTDLAPSAGRNTYEIWWRVSNTSSTITRLNEVNGSALTIIEQPI
jgi:hypothetical protein